MEQIGTRRNAWPTGPKPGFLELLSPPSTSRVAFHPRLTPSDDSLSEFGQHLLAGLHDPKARSEIKDLHTALATELSQLNQYAINLAIQDLARESAQELAQSLVARLRAKVGDQVKTKKAVASDQTKKVDFTTVGTPNQDPLVEKLNGDNSSAHAVISSGTASEGVNKDAPNSHIRQLPNLISAGGLRTREGTERTIQPENEASSRPSVNPTVEDGVSRLPSYDFIIFADSSGSRDSSSQRILAMKQAAQQILKVATTTSPKQRAELHFFDNPVTEPKIRRRSSAGAYKIGDEEASTAEEQVVGPLQEKILKLLARKLAITEFDNRTIVIVITNGSADGKQAPKLANSIAKFKEDLVHRGTDPTSVFFIFWQIGDNKEDDFFDKLDRDERIQDVICCRKENLANRMNADLNQGGKYNGQVVELLVEALNTTRGK